MKFIKISDLVSGDKLCINVYYPDGRIMLKEGVVLTDNLIKHMSRLNLNGIYIESEDLQGIKIDDGLGMDFRLQAISTLRTLYTELQKTGKIKNIKPAFDLANHIVDDIISKPNFIVQLKDIRNEDTYVYAHSINVSMLSALTARSLGYPIAQIKEVALGSLLHDIGKFYPNLKNNEEHTLKGFDVLRSFHEMPLKAAHIALQHHEKINGTGYPRNLNQKDFIDYAQICAMANDFDHFINSLDNDNLPHQGIEYIMSKSTDTYSLDIIKAFVQNTAPYPIGTKILLNNGDKGIVYEVRKSNPSRPVIFIPDKKDKLDLSELTTTFVNQILV